MDGESGLVSRDTAAWATLQAGYITRASDTATAAREGMIHIIVELHNLPTSTFAVKRLLSSLAQGSSRRPALLQTSLPPFAIDAALVAAVPVCGNGMCESGEATGTFGFDASQNCPQDCPFALVACPAQVRYTFVLLFRMPRESASERDMLPVVAV